MSKPTPTTPPLDREAKRRLAVIRHVEEVTGNVAMSCRYFGISRQAYYIWYRRCQAEGIEGLRTRSKAPKTSPNATHVEVVGKIIYLRQNYHVGPEKIAMYLQFTAIDDCTRLRVLKIYPTLNQATAIRFVDYVLQRLPFQVEVIQTDNGAEFQSAFHFHVLDKGIGRSYIKPRTPRLNGKVERSHRIDAEEFYRLLDGVIIDGAEVFNDKLREWEDSTTTIAPMEASAARHPTSASSRRPRPRRKRSSSVAQVGARWWDQPLRWDHEEV